MHNQQKTQNAIIIHDDLNLLVQTPVRLRAEPAIAAPKMASRTPNTLGGSVSISMRTKTPVPIKENAIKKNPVIEA
jgi:hypothetical protein